MILNNNLRRAIILGSGGHSRVIISILKMLRTHEIIGVIDLNVPREGEKILGVEVIGSVELLKDFSGLPDFDLYLAIGDNALRHAWWIKCCDLQINMPNLIAPSAIVDPTVSMGEGNLVSPNVFIGPAARIGSNNIFNTACIIEHEVIVGDHCHIAPNSTICGRVTIGSHCFIGAATTIIETIELASFITVGAGSVVVNNLPSSNKTYLGVPAKCLN
jgi:UDP-perosamine 4-acetyltransferase